MPAQQDVERPEDVPSARTVPSSPISGLIAGPLAGVCSRFVIYPGDTIKARLQIQGTELAGRQARYRGVWDAAGQIVRKEGVAGLYKGFGAVLVGNVPANAAYFGGYELGKSVVPPGWGLPGDMIVGAVAQLTGGLLFTPVDIIKERMQVQGILAPGQTRYSSSWDALRNLVLQRGPLGLFSGYWATNAVWIPWSMIHIATYEQLKKLAGSWGAADGPQTQGELPAWTLGVLSATSASLASLVTHPMDVIKTRLQVLSTSTTRLGSKRLSAVQLGLQAVRQEGAKVFMAGAFARIITLAPGSAVSWMVYEPIKRTLDQLLSPA